MNPTSIFKATSSHTSFRASPWCGVVSFVNPHDMNFYPAYFSSPNAVWGNGYNTANLPQNLCPPTSYPNYPPVGSYSAPGAYSTVPSPWNNADTLAGVKPRLQTYFLDNLNQTLGAVRTTPSNQWLDFLNNYIWIQSLVDIQIGNVISAFNAIPLPSSGPSVQSQTVILFTADHGDYAGSHGLHDKGGAAYDEAINIPLYVLIPNAGGTGLQTQTYYTATTDFMCSAVDFFALTVEFATGTGGWRLKNKYIDQKYRQSILYYIYHSLSQESRNASVAGTTTPFILYTTDETQATEFVAVPSSSAYPFMASSQSGLQNHVVCLRTKTPRSLSSTGQILNNGAPGGASGKLAIYDFWPACTDQPPTTVSAYNPTQYEFYDFSNNYGTTGAPNYGELGNQSPILNADASPYTSVPGDFCPAGSGSSNTLKLFCGLASALYGNNSHPGGLLANELRAPLTGVATDGTTLLSAVASDALTYVYPNHIGGYPEGPTGYYDYLYYQYGGVYGGPAGSYPTCGG